MAASKLTPFEQAICWWILKLPARWTRIEWDDLSHAAEKARDRLVRGGFIDAHLAVTLNVDGADHQIETHWRVTRNYSSALK